MLLTRGEFDQRLQAGTLTLCFVGMSNIGKSFRSVQLGELQGLHCHAVDDLIAAELGFADVGEIASWMGQPDGSDYAERQQQYLKLEAAITTADTGMHGNTVIDTTGSVIYLDDPLLADLKNRALVVEFRVPDSYLDLMINDYFANPKPVVWGEMFSRKAGESTDEALRRCYPQLLADRNRRYQALADLSLPGALTRDEAVSDESFWKMLLAALPEEIEADAKMP